MHTQFVFHKKYCWFRSDSEPLLFDISNVRVNLYDPDNDPLGARELVAGAIRDAFKERALQRQGAIKMAAKSLDIPSWAVLVMASASGEIKHFATGSIGKALGNAAGNAAISRLLGIGALETSFMRHSERSIREMKSDREMFSYKLTPFGQALITHVNSETLDLTEFWDEIMELLAQSNDAKNR